MEKKTGGRRGIEQRAADMLKSLLCAYIVTGILLLILTLLLYKAGLSEENINAGIILTYVISTFSGGFVIGKLTGARKFLWGLLLGVVYFLLLTLISLGIYHSLQSDLMNLTTTFLLCAGGGMLGGMIS
ncbi:MAG TPA: TIGR04086 family membrane protein [Candidatus Mediterraneibacter gallistercoris]|uniref:TIGR04086 family membrane protein n=1 Tax=Candidatus Mediterraneibacter gallistercoris TaxID=2838671 RepID=A0A9D2T1W9_9FIRM|nr:TIGR04086 family membrane protein [Candidatus Mediterraneibacter gallistercoris]